jgi:hypothetical protein
VQTRTEVSGGGNGLSASSTTIVVFRLEPEDGSRPVNVEMHGWRLNGTVVDGETVDVTGRYTAPGLLRASRIVSRDTGTAMEPARLPSGAKFLLLFLGFVVAVALVVGAIVAIALLNRPDHDTEPTPTPTRTNDVFSDLRERSRQQCLDNPAFTDEQCAQLFPTP